MDLVAQPIGSEGALSVKLEGGKLVLEIKHLHASGEVSLVAKEDAKYFLEKLKVAIPGSWDDLLISVVEGSLP